MTQNKLASSPLSSPPPPKRGATGARTKPVHGRIDSEGSDDDSNGNGGGDSGNEGGGDGA